MIYQPNQDTCERENGIISNYIGATGKTVLRKLEYMATLPVIPIRTREVGTIMTSILRRKLRREGLPLHQRHREPLW